MKLVLLCRDLMLVSRLEGIAVRNGFTTFTAADQASALSAVEDDDCQTLFVDLQLPGLDIAVLVKQIRESTHKGVRIVACGPHVHEHRLATARQAGCDQVVTRGQLDREADGILKMTNDE